MTLDGFGLDHLPYGVFVAEGSAPRVGVRYHDTVVDVADRAAGARPARPSTPSWPSGPTPGPRPGHRSSSWSSPRRCRRSRSTRCPLLLPFAVGDYVDFYASLDHATNVGRIFRPDQEPLLPNWRHLPVGYHGRSGTVVVSGTPVVRPCGQRKSPTEDCPDVRAQPAPGHRGRARLRGRRRFGARQPDPGRGALAARLRRGRPERLERPRHPGLGVRTARTVPGQVLRHVGECLGDSPGGARRRPASTCRRRNPPRFPTWLDRLDRRPALDIAVEVVLNGEVVSRPPYRTMYWSPGQMLAHLTVNGASTRTGDLFASGTISGPEPDTRGSFLELSWGGKEPFARWPHVPRGRRRGDPALLGARHRRRPDHPRRGHRPHRPGSSRVLGLGTCCARRAHWHGTLCTPPFGNLPRVTPSCSQPFPNRSDRFRIGGGPDRASGAVVVGVAPSLGGVAMSSRRFGSRSPSEWPRSSWWEAVRSLRRPRTHPREDLRRGRARVGLGVRPRAPRHQHALPGRRHGHGEAGRRGGGGSRPQPDDLRGQRVPPQRHLDHPGQALVLRVRRSRRPPAGKPRVGHLEADPQRPGHRARPGDLHRQPQPRVRPDDRRSRSRPTAGPSTSARPAAASGRPTTSPRPPRWHRSAPTSPSSGDRHPDAVSRHVVRRHR